MMPPKNAESQAWAERLQNELSNYTVSCQRQTKRFWNISLMQMQSTVGCHLNNYRWRKICDGFRVLPRVPFPGFYYPALIDHPVVVCNPRGIYNDHIAQHIMMFVLALARGLPYYMDAQRDGIWNNNARKSGYIDLTEATALIVGVGGIGHETARICAEFGMQVIGVDVRWEYAVPFVEKHEPAELDTLLPLADFCDSHHTAHTGNGGNVVQKSLHTYEKTANFINIGRGKTTKLVDLIEALEQGTIADVDWTYLKLSHYLLKSVVAASKCVDNTAYCC